MVAQFFGEIVNRYIYLFIIIIILLCIEQSLQTRDTMTYACKQKYK